MSNFFQDVSITKGTGWFLRKDSWPQSVTIDTQICMEDGRKQHWIQFLEELVFGSCWSPEKLLKSKAIAGYT